MGNKRNRRSRRGQSPSLERELSTSEIETSQSLGRLTAHKPNPYPQLDSNHPIMEGGMKNETNLEDKL